MRRALCVAAAAAVLAACAPPADPGVPVGRKSVSDSVHGTARHNGVVFCLATVNVEFTLQGTTAALLVTNFTVAGVGTDGILCEPRGWVIGGTFTCDPGCGSEPFNVPLLEQSLTPMTYTRPFPNGATLAVAVTGSYFGVNDGGVSTLVTPPIRCWAAQGVCLFT